MTNAETIARATATARPVAQGLTEMTGDAANSIRTAALFAAFMEKNRHAITADNVDEALDAFRVFCMNANK